MLGTVALALKGGTLVLDAGELRSALWPLPGEPDRFVFADAPVVRQSLVISLRQGTAGAPEVVLAGSSTTGEGAAAYVFLPVPTPAPAATPVPSPPDWRLSPVRGSHRNPGHGHASDLAGVA